MKTPRLLFPALVLVLVSLARGLAGEATAPGETLDDPLLDQLVGDWNVERTMGSGRKAKNVVHGEWVLDHQFVQLHYCDAATPPHYEAMVLIGYDAVGKRYICHWADTTGPAYSADGFGPRDEASNAIDLKFTFHDGDLTNRYAFDPQAHTWTSTIRQVENGEWKLFCEDKFVRAVR